MRKPRKKKTNPYHADRLLQKKTAPLPPKASSEDEIVPKTVLDYLFLLGLLAVSAAVFIYLANQVVDLLRDGGECDGYRCRFWSHRRWGLVGQVLAVAFLMLGSAGGIFVTTTALFSGAKAHSKFK